MPERGGEDSIFVLGRIGPSSLLYRKRPKDYSVMEMGAAREEREAYSFQWEGGRKGGMLTRTEYRGGGAVS